MTRWSWVIDHTRCIGCHACTTACKSENDVALGVFRTWVKQVDVGAFPDVKRHFAVLRCNHCADAPCVEICPVTAMYQRPDGLVDFDHEICIGCKACMQACPYDAIHMDPDSNTAAKCNFCSHRVDAGQLPACVVVCPTEALVFGDLEDPASRAARLVKEQPVTVRRPEQKTRPHAFYIGAHEAALDPLGAVHDGYAWAEGGTEAQRHRGTGGHRSPVTGHRLPVAGRRLPVADAPARVSYDTQKPRPWGWKVSAYIWTKSLAAGGGLLAALEAFRGAEADPFVRWFAPLLALAALGVTGVLLIADLKRPERFWTILTRPQWRSWLAKGAVIITAYGAALAAALAFTALGADLSLRMLAAPLLILAVLTAVYTAWLFAQCEGRDLWQAPRLAFTLLLHAAVAGFAAVLIAEGVTGRDPGAGGLIFAALLVALAATQATEAFSRHATANGAAAAHALTRGRYAQLFWGATVGGAAMPAALAAVGSPAAVAVAAVLALGGLLAHAHAFVLAGQEPPIS